MRILQVSPGYKTAWKMGGTVQVVASLAEALQNIGHQVTVATTNANYDESLDAKIGIPLRDNGVTVIYFSRGQTLRRYFPKVFRKRLGLLYCRGMRPWLKQNIKSFDIVNVHMPFIYSTAVATRLASRLNVPVVYHDHGVLDDVRLRRSKQKKKIYIALIEKRNLALASLIVALNDESRKSLERLTNGEKPLVVMPNGVDVSYFKEHRNPGENRKNEIIFFGQLLPVKGPELLLLAFRLVADEFPSWQLKYYGPDPDSMWPLLREKARKAGLASQVFYGGTLSGSRRVRILSQAGLFVLPSLSEGFPLAPLEAMACGCPVLISPQCRLDIVEKEGGGLIRQPTVEEIAHGIRTIISNPYIRLNMGIAGRKIVVSYFSWERIAKQLANYYESLSVDSYHKLNESN